MNLNRWLMTSRIVYAPETEGGSAAAASSTGDGASKGQNNQGSAEAATGAESPATPPSALASADSSNREGAPKGDAATESSGSDAGKETPAKAGDAPPPGGAEGKSDADGKDAKPDAATEAGKDAAKDKTAEGKPEGTDPAADNKDAAAETQPPAPPTYDAYTLPENFKLDDGKLSEFNTILGKAELSGKADHAAMQALGQELVDFYAREVDRIGREVTKHQVDVWNRHCEQEFNVLKNDAELGGNRINTTLGNAKYVLEQFGGSKAEQDRLMASLDRSGISHNRDFVALLHRMFERYREPEPVSPNLPSVAANQPGQRNWYQTVDGKA